jgi:hypothetical protein
MAAASIEKLASDIARRTLPQSIPAETRDV